MTAAEGSLTVPTMLTLLFLLDCDASLELVRVRLLCGLLSVRLVSPASVDIANTMDKGHGGLTPMNPRKACWSMSANETFLGLANLAHTCTGSGDCTGSVQAP